MRKHLRKIKELQGRFLYLMISLVIVLLSYSFFKTSSWHTFFSWFIGILVLGSAVYADSDNKKHLFLAAALGLSYILFSLFSLFSTSKALFFLASLSSVIFFTYTVILIIDSMLKKHEVTPNTIYGAISVYLLIGFIFSIVFGFVTFIEPNSITNSLNATNTVQNISHPDVLYYSYVTLTTLGFGDFIPTNSVTQTISILEAIIGQLYLTILIALLISNFIPYRRKPKAKKAYVQKKLNEITKSRRKKISK